MGSDGMRASLDQPRGHRRLDRAGRARQHVRRRRRARRLRQDDPGRASWRWRGSTCPAWSSTADRSRPGAFDGRDVTIQDVFEAVGAHARRHDDRRATSSELEDSACPGAGACGGQFTANTMATACEFLGISPFGSASVPADDRGQGRRGEARRRAGHGPAARAASRPRQILTRDALENAIAAVAATGGSTNAVLHLLAIAREAGVPLDIDDFDRDQRPRAAARRPQAGRPLRRDRPAPRRRHAARRQRLVDSRACCTRTP